MEDIFYFYLKGSVDDIQRETPICTQSFIGDIGDFVELDGVGYIITDYKHERHSWSELGGE